jgi:hypothetical protein
MITKEKTLLMLLLVLSTLTVSADRYDDYPGYQGYKNAYKEWFGVDISIPESMVRCYDNEHKDQLWTEFGNPDESNTKPAFAGYAIVELSEFCDVITDDIISWGKPKQGGPLDFDDRIWFDHILYNNCGIPYTDWYQYSMDREKLEAKRKKAIRKYSYSFPEISNVIKRTNARNCYILKIPHYNKITAEDKDYAKRLKRYDTCYLVEFHRLNQVRGVYMLFFVNSKYGRSIDSYIEQISHYISFDKDFTFE